MRGNCTCLVESIVALTVIATGVASAVPINGVVVEDRSGNSVGFAEVRVVRLADAAVMVELETDSDGRFRTPELAPGEYRLRISKPNYLDATLPFRVEESANPPEPISAKLVRCGAIAGRVADAEGQPLIGATVFAMKRSADDATLRPSLDRAGSFAQVDDTGAYRLYHLPPGRYVVAVAYGHSTIAVGTYGGLEPVPAAGSGVLLFPSNSHPKTFEVSSGDEYTGIDFAVAPGWTSSLRGKVESPDSRTGFWLSLVAHEQPALATAAAQAGPNGDFRFDGIPPGSFDLLASGPVLGRRQQGAELDDKPLFGRITVDVGATDVAGLTVPLQHGRQASFILRTPADGAKCGSGIVKLTLQPVEDWAAQLDREVEVSATKPVRVDNLAPGLYRLALGGIAPECRIAGETTIDAGKADAPIAIALESTPLEATHK
ncbi:MAG: carboxypeptidase-like regulatory domain-containing protein [Bryobacteraceae bacterium]